METITRKTSSYNPLSFLNVFKIVAAFSVFLIHYTGKTIVSNCPFMSFLAYGTEPVGIFFVISGVLFFFAYYIKIKTNKTTFKDFFIKRIIKFWPLLIIMSVCFYLFALYAYFSNTQVPDWVSPNIFDFLITIFFASPVLFTGDFGNIVSVAWYISVLMFCYLIAFLLTKLDKKVKNKTIFLAPLILGIIMIMLNAKYPFFNVLLGRGLFAFFLGFYVAYALEKFAKFKSKTKIIIRICLLILPIFRIVMSFFPNYDSVIFVYPYITVPITYIAPLFFVFYDLKWFNKFSEFKPFKYLSNISFDFYMLHSFVIGTLGTIDISFYNTWWLLIIIVIYAIVVSSISYFAISVKFCNYLEKKLGYAH